jgi:NosR/NirI family nitrous oxide reductase transcriptional regulator
MAPSIRPWLVRAWRLLAVVCAAWLLHLAAERDEGHRRQNTIPIEQARRLFPEAASVKLTDNQGAPEEVFDENGRSLGFIARTSPQADSIIGYAGPNNVLVGLSKSGRIIGLELLSSGDTDAHIKDVKAAEGFWEQFIGWSPSHESMTNIEGVAGSTLTSLGIAESIQKRLAGRVDSLRFPEPVTLDEIQDLFPEAQSFQTDQPKPGWHEVKTSAGKLLGFVVRTSPFSDFTRGHAGPTESLVAVAPDANKVTGVRLRRSYDTDDYADSVREDAGYLKQLTQFDVQRWRTMDLKTSGLEGVSGATETSFAVAEGIRRRFAGEALQAEKSAQVGKPRDWALLGVVIGSLVMAFSPLRGKRYVRIAWQAVLIGVFGLWIGDLLSLALLAGWARNGIAWQIAPALVLLAALALMVPWTTRRQLYCHQLCPHGVAQEWLGSFPKLHLRIPPTVEKYLRVLPGAILAGAFIIGIAAPGFELAAIEPFDAWAMRGVVLAATIIAIVGLVAALFVPMAYCRFGCPTGALLKFIRTTGSADRFSGRDGAAIGLLITGAVLVFWPNDSFAPKTTGPDTVLQGAAFGTTWSVKLRELSTETNTLQQSIAAELERIESSLSHWRSNSATAQFNRAQTIHAVEMPAELVRLVAQTLEISRATDGAFDITVGPLVQAWGFGPGNAPPIAPAKEEIARLRSFTGWQKLHADTNANTLQKNHPQLQIDLGAILQGYAADRVAELLSTAGIGEFLINIGGELQARGKWRIAIENPAQPEQPIRVLFLENASLATSGTYRASKGDGERRWSHIIDPQTGKPIEHDIQLVSLLHPSCAMSDAWATALLVSGQIRGDEIAKQNRLSVLIVSEKGVSAMNFPAPESLNR